MSSIENNEEEEDCEEEEVNMDVLYTEFFNYFLPAKKTCLNFKECKSAMRSLGLLITEQELVEMLNLKEKTGNEQISLEEFKSFCQERQGKENLADLEKAFQLYDTNRTGKVKANQLKHAMMIFKPKMTEEEIEQILSEFGIDENGDINYLDYINNSCNAEHSTSENN